MNSKKILEIKNLSISFKTYAGIVQAVRGVDLELNSGEVLAIVGESGCGKTVTAKSIMRLLPENQTIIGQKSEIEFEGEDLLDFNKKKMAEVRGKDISMIFQDPMSSLNPTMKIGRQIAETIVIHENKTMHEAKEEALRMLELVKIPNARKRINQYPFEFSGGMRQRVMIAIALACNPKILIADEPTTALDVTIQAQILDLIKELQSEFNTGVILITHDLGVVAGTADRIQVMYSGKILEKGTTNEIFYRQKHPYTYALLESIPKFDATKKEKLYSLAGTPPDLINPPTGCPFAARCEFGMKICRTEYPDPTDFTDTHESVCWLYHPKSDTTNLPKTLLVRGETNE